MNKQVIHKQARSINLSANSDREFFLIHGYTGSPSDFRDLPQVLHKKFDANVRVIRLQGHGTKVEDLNRIKLNDFIKQVETELIRDLEKGRKIIIGGYSFGAQLALYLATKYKLAGVFTISLPYKFKFPFGIKGIKYITYLKKYWKKRLTIKELKLREGCFNYSVMPTYALTICLKLNKILKRDLKKIKCPFLSIHSKKDPIAKYEAIEEIENKVGSKIKRKYLFEDGNHNLSHSFYKKITVDEIVNFFEKYVFKEKTKKTISKK